MARETPSASLCFYVSSCNPHAEEAPLPLRAFHPSLLRLTPAAQFLMQGTAECRFGRGSPPRRVRFLAHYFYNQQEILHFDSDLGAFLAVLELGLPEARSWNSRKDLLEMYQAEVDLFCRKNHEAVRAIVRQVQPTVTISPSRNDPLSPRTLLLCTAAGFYPPEIEVRWLKNGRRATEGVFYGEVLQNGDWTYQTQMMLEDTPQRGDVYACQVEHASLETPIAVQWARQKGPPGPSSLIPGSRWLHS
uniref:Ig-like domain-containing protein n=1 Tax=Varanus komodoensis TaxID=61221 RepID=A0A8D2Q3W2_VARKO